MKWINIPGYTDYEICCETLSVRNIRTGKVMSCVRGSVRLSKKGCQKNYTPQRLLYAALRGCCPDMISERVVVIKGREHLEVFTRAEYSRLVVDKSNESRIQSKGSYIDLKRFVDTVVCYMETRDSQELMRILYGYRSKAILYCLKNRYICNEKDAADYVDIAIERTFERISSGMVIAFPFRYIVDTAKWLKRSVKQREVYVQQINNRFYEKRRFIPSDWD